MLIQTTQQRYYPMSMNNQTKSHRKPFPNDDITSFFLDDFEDVEIPLNPNETIHVSRITGEVHSSPHLLNNDDL